MNRLKWHIGLGAAVVILAVVACLGGLWTYNYGEPTFDELLDELDSADCGYDCTVPITCWFWTLRERQVYVTARGESIPHRTIQLISRSRLICSLDLKFVEVTRRDIAAISKMTRLEHLEICGENVDDGALLQLAGCASLNWLYLKCTRTTTQGVTRFQELRPDVVVLEQYRLAPAVQAPSPR